MFWNNALGKRTFLFYFPFPKFAMAAAIGYSPPQKKPGITDRCVCLIGGINTYNGISILPPDPEGAPYNPHLSAN